MPITVTPPTIEHHIVTDLDALGHAIDLTGRLDAIAKAPGGATEAEAAEARRQSDLLADQLREAAQAVEASTITLHLHGLRSNAWNQIVAEHTRLRDGRQERDLPAMLAQAMPAMLDSVTDADGKTVPMADGETASLLDSLSDSQTLDLWRAVQGLNTPPTALPKETLTLLASLG